MKRFPWKDFFKRHPFFWSLNEQDIRWLLQDGVSEEQACSRDSVIVREGDFGDSIFLIGSGSVRVVLLRETGQETRLSTLGKGDLFGEMALFEQRARSATILAEEDCTLLEIRGHEFLKFLQEHHDIEFKILLKLSERLRHLNEQVLAVQLKDVDERLRLLNTKLDTEMRVFDTSLKAAQAVFDQTKLRADEIINSAERSRTRLTASVAAFGSAISIAIMLLGWVGYNKLQDMTSIETGVKEIERSIKQTEKDLGRVSERIGEKYSEVEQQSLKLAQNLRMLPVITERTRNSLLGVLHWAFEESSESYAVSSYDQLLKLDDSNLTKRLLGEIELGIAKKRENREIYKKLLNQTIDYVKAPMEKITAYVLALTLMILDDQNGAKYDDLFKKYAEYMRDQPAQGQRFKEQLDFSLFDNLFNSNQAKRFTEVKDLIP